MTDSQTEALWQGGDARQIMKEARRRFAESEWEDYDEGNTYYPAEAYVALASTHYSLVKRYVVHAALWYLAVWHMWRAVANAKRAGIMLSPDEADVVSRILLQAPRFLGGNLHQAHRVVQAALNETKETQPHTRALLLITIAEIEEKLGKPFSDVFERIMQAVNLYEGICCEEDQLMAKRQWTRIASSCGFWCFDHAMRRKYKIAMRELMKDMARELIPEALELAREVAKDQEEKILAECKKRGLNPRDLRRSIEMKIRA